QNLVVNAIKYRKKNGKTSINISVTDKDSGIQLVVQDTGIGMSQEEREKIFTKGYRASLEAEGNGFGLYSVHKYLQVLNGSIQVESRLNIGTIFTVFIPSIDNN
nr:ATP-binding protein [Chitinophagaceae bacterium]